MRSASAIRHRSIRIGPGFGARDLDLSFAYTWYASHRAPRWSWCPAGRSPDRTAPARRTTKTSSPIDLVSPIRKGPAAGKTAQTTPTAVEPPQTRLAPPDAIIIGPRPLHRPLIRVQQDLARFGLPGEPDRAVRLRERRRQRPATALAPVAHEADPERLPSQTSQRISVACDMPRTAQVST